MSSDAPLDRSGRPSWRSVDANVAPTWPPAAGAGRDPHRPMAAAGPTVPAWLAGRWSSRERVVPGLAGHLGCDLRDFFLAVTVWPNGWFTGAHTAYLPCGKDPVDPADPRGFRYLRSPYMLGAVHGVLDGAGGGWIAVGGYGMSDLRVSVGPAPESAPRPALPDPQSSPRPRRQSGQGSGPVLLLRLCAQVVAYRPVMFSRAVLLRD